MQRVICMMRSCTVLVALLLFIVVYRDVLIWQPDELAKHVLAEVPRQVCEYYSIYGIQPGTGALRR